MNKRQIVASLNNIANQLDNNGLYNEANTVTKVMSRLAMDEDDEHNIDEYLPDDERYFMNEDEDEDPKGFSHKDMYEGFGEVSDMLDQMGTSNEADDLLSHHAKDYNDPKISDLAVVFEELDHMIRENDMLTPEQLRKYRQIKSKLMNS